MLDEILGNTTFKRPRRGAQRQPEWPEKEEEDRRGQARKISVSRVLL